MWLHDNEPVSLPNCEALDKFGFYIPNHQDLTEDNIKTITNILNFNE